MLDIQKKFIKYNTKPKKVADKIEYIVIHDTGNTQKGSNALAHFNYFNSKNRNASADFFVDDMNIIQTTDYRHNYSWQVGDGKGKYGVTNQNSIGIEICINSDGDYNKAVVNTVELAYYLLKELNLPIERLIRHFDATRKNCPQSMNYDGDWKMWYNFKDKVKMLLDKDNDEELNWKTEAINFLASEGIISDPIGWKEKVDLDMPVWAVMIIVKNMYQKLKK